MNFKSYTREIASLDPKRDYERIAYLLTFHCFPWDMEKALEFALFRTFAVPSVSRLLVATGEFVNRTRKRYDDTELILYEILENGMDSERGRAAIARMNAMHARFKISNEDYLYVLSTFIFEPIRWMDRWGWRPFTTLEKEAILINYQELAKRMNIVHVPDSLQSFEAFNLKYEQSHFSFHQANRKIGDKTLDLLIGFYLPRRIIPLGRPFAYCLMDPPLRKAMALPNPPKSLCLLVEKSMRLKALLAGSLPERKKPALGTKRKRSTYPEGYQIEELGTFGHRK
ncbi:oxygenase MpaB family protein [Cyclobacterium jeungdonense]|uniref:Oxygenase MpaB family protein n=1 Tax=Cyclobacterium jeungdonense TaxID=708087 RepID=A0ABT8C9A2_9BACT|nr:oxygenase MpaB family protein [Cyclobacterium jeungdonense]MDN3688662.1 oxygenase MpaB family protein [Cyclobacterium jeungdonense]